MKKQKQLDALYILATGRYKVVDGVIYRLSKGHYKTLRPMARPNGYAQVRIFSGERYGRGRSCVIYTHILSYLAAYGEYPEGYEIDHKDRDKSNIKADNLRAVPTRRNSVGEGGFKRGEFNPMRDEHIKQIRDIWANNHGISKAEVARRVGLNRLTVLRAICKIEKGEPFKFEHTTAA